jgi:hypothetical protein
MFNMRMSVAQVDDGYVAIILIMFSTITLTGFQATSYKQKASTHATIVARVLNQTYAVALMGGMGTTAILLYVVINS